MTKIPISVCIIAKNEEKHIEQCLKHLIKYGMEIVVVDTGSEDATVELARKYTSNVYETEWKNSFSEARNYAAKQAKNNWILVVDCDEYMQEIDISKLRICMQKYNKAVGMLNLNNMKTSPNGQVTYNMVKIPRFYNKNFYEFRFDIHEQITPKGATDLQNVTLNTFEMPAVAEHHGYDISKDEMLKKQERNLELLQEAVENDRNDDYIYFQMGQSYIAIGRYQEALEAYEKCFKINKSLEKEYMPIALKSYLELLIGSGQYLKGYELASRYEDNLPTAYLWYLYGLSADRIGHAPKALMIFTKLTFRKDFEALGKKAYEVYAKILSLCKNVGDEEMMNYYRYRLVQYASEHGEQIKWA